jgi:hypothetical protein
MQIGEAKGAGLPRRGEGEEEAGGGREVDGRPKAGVR